jgi:hypothetical protein
MKRIVFTLAFCSMVIVTAAPAGAQTLAVDDPVVRQIWTEATEHSQFAALAHELVDVIGPRLTGSPQDTRAHEWAVEQFESWGIEAQNEQWGVWESWQRGICHIDMLQPWVKTLSGNLMSWSPGLRRPVEAEIVIIPEVADAAAFEAWLPNVKGKWVLISFPEPSGRPHSTWQTNATTDTYDEFLEDRGAAMQAFNENLQRAGFEGRRLDGVVAAKMEEAGAAGVICMGWPNLWNTWRTFTTYTRGIPSFIMGLEDYTLLYRLAESGHTPVVEIEAEATSFGEQPTFNTVAMIRGVEKPDEYIVLSGHLDSWDTSTGAVDNASGCLLAMEVLRILKQVYPHPKRTIVVGLWGSEEQGLNGSASFVEDHPEIVAGLQAGFNFDSGIGRISRLSDSGFVEAGSFLAEWLVRLPAEVGRHITLTVPGSPSSGGSDHASFIAAGAPFFSLGTSSWDYGYTWHTQIDTYDKLVMPEMINNVVVEACLAYLASEAEETIPRTKRIMLDRQGNPRPWPTPRTPTRRGGGGGN